MALIILVLIVGISFFWVSLHPNPIAQQIKSQIDFRDELLKSFERSHPELKDCQIKGNNIVCTSG
jgi:hypothetical protein